MTKPFKIIYPADVDRTMHYTGLDKYTIRHACRGVILNDKNNVALVHVGKYDYYMLPGGGIDEDDHLTALSREISEELGAKIKVIKSVGSIETYIPRWSNRQIDHCYAARVIRDTGMRAPTDFEISEGHEIVWADNIDAGIQLMKDTFPLNLDGKLIQMRDLAFLGKAKLMLDLW